MTAPFLSVPYKVTLRFGADLFMGYIDRFKFGEDYLYTFKCADDKDRNATILRRLFIKANKNGFSYSDLSGLKIGDTPWPVSTNFMDVCAKIDKLRKYTDNKTKCTHLNGVAIPPALFEKIKANKKWST